MQLLSSDDSKTEGKTVVIVKPVTNKPVTPATKPASTKPVVAALPPKREPDKPVNHHAPRPGTTTAFVW